MEYEILVQLKGEVLDPEGRAIQGTLKSQGYHDVAKLANPVAETYLVRSLP
ncbi:MAG: phosphoribosylformylglycinamidine synthase subunit PurS [Proteobacteria bacterium]|nr:phosphoribosylformylglycinamidine synthase subunit PurS [Pseudomonadota bacterium]